MPISQQPHLSRPRRGRRRRSLRIGAAAGGTGLVAALALLPAPASAAGAGELRVTLDNPGTAELTPTFTVVPTGSDGDCPAADGYSLTGDDAGPAPAGTTTTYDLTLDVDPDCVGNTAALVVSGTGMTTSTAKVPTTREIGGWHFWPPLLVALAAGLAFWLAATAAIGDKKDGRIPTGDSWSFSGSWLTSISAVTTALAGVLAASGFVTELLPGIPLGHFLGLSLTFGALVVAAPMVFAIYQVTDQEPDDPSKANPVMVPVLLGRLRGLVNAGALTCAGAAGLITMFVVLTVLSDAGAVSKIVVAALLVLVGVVSAVYVSRSTVNTVKASDALTPPDGADESSGTSPVSQSGVLTRMQTTGITGTF
jgi:hypothetical protein